MVIERERLLAPGMEVGRALSVAGPTHGFGGVLAHYVLLTLLLGEHSPSTRSRWRSAPSGRLLLTLGLRWFLILVVQQ